MVWPTDTDLRLGEFDAIELPGQQLLSAQATSPLDHLLNLDIKAPPGCQRLTGIMVSMGKSTNDLKIMEELLGAGMNIALINLSFGTREEHIETIKMLRQASKNFSVAMRKVYPLAIAVKLPGRKIRTGKIADTFGDSVELRTGEPIRLTTDETYSERCSMYTIYIDFMYFADQMHKGDIILLDNETMMLKVEIISTTTLTCVIERGGFLGSYKDVFVPNVVFQMANYSERDKADIAMSLQHQTNGKASFLGLYSGYTMNTIREENPVPKYAPRFVDIYLAPFVNSASAVTELRGILGEKGKKAAIIANIQTIEGYRNFDDIIAVSDGVMVTRQELGSDITPKKLVIAQKNMVARANKANVPVSVSAHLLSSMRYQKVPLRAELLDIANCIIDGVDNLMLSAETAVGQYPVETVAALATACKEAESCLWSRQIYHDFVDKTPIPCDQTTGAAMAAVLAAQRTLAAAIVVVTTTGKSARIVSKFKPRCPIVAVTRYAAIARQLHLWRGIMPVVYEDAPDVDWATDLEKRVNFCSKWAMERGFIRVGDPVVIVSGWKQGAGFTNTMRIVYAAANTTVA